MSNEIIGTLVFRAGIIDVDTEEVWAEANRCYPFYDDTDGRYLILSLDYPHDSGFVRVQQDTCEDVRYEPGIMFIKPTRNIFNDVDAKIILGEGVRTRVIKETEKEYTVFSEKIEQHVQIHKNDAIIDEIVGFDFKEYAKQCAVTAVYPKENELEYLVFGLLGEAGELANKFKKIFRDDGGVIKYERAASIEAEIGDILWYIARLTDYMNGDLNQVAYSNLTKLRARQSQNLLKGDGDNRGTEETSKE